MFFTKNPQILHITCEIIVLCTLIFWISSGKKKLSLQVEKLLLRLEEQEEKIQRMEIILEQMNTNHKLVDKKVNNLLIKQQQQQQLKKSTLFTPSLIPSLTRSSTPTNSPNNSPNHSFVNDDFSNFSIQPDNIQPNVQNVILTSKKNNESESDLDEELKEELEELRNEYDEKSSLLNELSPSKPVSSLEQEEKNYEGDNDEPLEIISDFDLKKKPVL